jgi:hypothetical protein
LSPRIEKTAKFSAAYSQAPREQMTTLGKSGVLAATLQRGDSSLREGRRRIALEDVPRRLAQKSDLLYIDASQHLRHGHS